MVKAKAGGIILGGLAGYLILSKGINMVGNAVKNICVAHQWKNYYKYGKDGNMVAPGYEMRTRKENGDDVQVGEKGSIENEKAPQQKASGAAVGEAIAKAITELFAGLNKQEEAPEGQEKASGEAEKDTDEKDICPENCDICNVSKCPWEHLKNGGKITKWSEIKHEPVAGRYPWSTDGLEQLEWKVTLDPDRLGPKVNGDVANIELKDPLYTDDLYDGVKIVDDEEKTPDEIAALDRAEDMNIDMMDVLVNGKDPGDPDGLNKEASEEE